LKPLKVHSKYLKGFSLYRKRNFTLSILEEGSGVLKVQFALEQKAYTRCVLLN